MKQTPDKDINIDGEQTHLRYDNKYNLWIAEFEESEIKDFIKRSKIRTAKEIFDEIENWINKNMPKYRAYHILRKIDKIKKRYS